MSLLTEKINDMYFKTVLSLLQVSYRLFPLKISCSESRNLLRPSLVTELGSIAPCPSVNTFPASRSVTVSLEVGENSRSSKGGYNIAVDFCLVTCIRHHGALLARWDSKQTLLNCRGDPILVIIPARRICVNVLKHQLASLSPESYRDDCAQSQSISLTKYHLQEICAVRPSRFLLEGLPEVVRVKELDDDENERPDP